MQPVTVSFTPSAVMVASNHKKLICTYISCRGVLVWGWNKVYCFKRYCSKLSFGRVPQNFMSLLVELQDVAATSCPRQSWFPVPSWVLRLLISGDIMGYLSCWRSAALREGRLAGFVVKQIVEGKCLWLSGAVENPLDLKRPRCSGDFF